jgi:MerR family redox-sensitive transcriptional activator SoxR
MTIGKVAKVTGVPASTIRYYESAGIIPKPARKNGVRHYEADAIVELKVLRFYRATGIPIRGLAAIGQARGSAAMPTVWTEVMRARIEDLDTWMLEAQQNKELLEHVITCRCKGKRERCKVVRVAEAMRTPQTSRPRARVNSKRQRRDVIAAPASVDGC